jgi:hypothetical protein
MCRPSVVEERDDTCQQRQEIDYYFMRNANKFTERGAIRTDACQGRENGRDWITIAVADIVIGMTAEQWASCSRSFRKLPPPPRANMVALMSFPKIISARSDDAIQIEQAPQRWSQITERPVPAACPCTNPSGFGSRCDSLNIKTGSVVNAARPRSGHDPNSHAGACLEAQTTNCHR